MDILTISSFVAFTAIVGFLTWLITRKDNLDSNTGYFLAGRSLTFPLIAGSLLLTNLSTEQLVGLNGDAFKFGLCVMVWEVVAVIALVLMAWFFLPRFLKSGVATVPEYLQIRFDAQTQLIANIIFLLFYVGLLLPMILYTGAVGLMNILDVTVLFTSAEAKDAIQAAVGQPDNETLVAAATAAQAAARQTTLIATIWAVGIIGSIYAIFGGLRSVAVSDTLNGLGLLVGGFLITGYALAAIGGGEGMLAGAEKLYDTQRERFNSVGSLNTNVPFGTIFSGIFLLNLFYWTTNQQIIQRTFAASTLAEGQKGVLLCGALKLLGPLYLVLPGMLAYALFAGQNVDATDAYGKLVNRVLPPYLTGFFAAVMMGAILSSFNSALNSSCTLFSLGIYKNLLQPSASDRTVVRSGVVFGVLIAVLSMLAAPYLDGQQSIFGYLQKMNTIYFIPLFAVVLVGMVTRRVPPAAAKFGMLTGFSVIALGYFVPPFDRVVASLHTFTFVGVVFTWLVVIMLVIGEIWPSKTEFEQVDVKAVDMTPWRGAIPVGLILIAAVIAIYVQFADFSVLPLEFDVVPKEAAQ